MKTNEFIDLVKQMRDAQKQYFLTRDRTIMSLAKKLERLVDQAIRDMNEPKLY